MNRRKFLILLMTLLVILALAGVVLAASGVTIDWQVLSGGGAPASGGSVTLNDTLGQPVIGTSSSGDTVLSAGYWFVPLEEGFYLYLPLVLR